MNWETLALPFTKGLAQDDAVTAFSGPGGLITASNLDFGTKGAVKGRPGLSPLRAYSRRSLSITGAVSYSDPSTVTNLSEMDYTNPIPFTLKDALGEREGLLTRGRAFTRGNGSWVDRGTVLPVRSRRLQNLAPADQVTGRTVGTDSYDATPDASYDFGPVETRLVGSPAFMGIYDTDGRVVSQATASTGSGLGAGLFSSKGARCGSVSALLVEGPAANQFSLVMHTAGSTTVTTSVAIITDAFNASTHDHTLVVPSICCDSDADVFYIAYWTTTLNQLKVLRVSTAGVVLTSNTYIAAANSGPGTALNRPGGLWISNSSLAVNCLVLTYGSSFLGSGVNTKILNATTLADAGLDVNIIPTGCTNVHWDAFSPFGQVVCGVVSATEAVIAFTTNTSVAGTAALVVARRALTAATSTVYWVQRYFTSGIAGVGTGVNASHSAPILGHQPIVLAGRILLGLSSVQGVSFNGSGTVNAVEGNLTATWMVADITELWATGTTTGRDLEPAIIARGAFSSSAPSWVPRNAIIGPDGDKYRFSTVDYSDVYPSSFSTITHPAPGAGLTTSGAVMLLGAQGFLAQNEIVALDPQVTHFGESTVIAGNVPYLIDSETVHPAGWPMLDAPTIQVVNGLGAGVTATHGVTACWAYTDANGRIHRSAPAPRITCTWAGTGATFNVTVSAPMFSGRPLQPAANSSSIYLEVYATDSVMTTADAPHYLVSATKWTPYTAGTTVTITTNRLGVKGTAILYTDGGVLANQLPNASGGVVTVGDRCWVSDGVSVFASKIGDEVSGKEAPGWNLEGPLTVRMPVSAGRIVGLQRLGEFLTILTETGAWLLGGQGPNDLGSGQGFTSPLQVSQVGLLNQRSAVTIPQGVLYVANFGGADGSVDAGGLWLVSGESAKQVSSPVVDAMSTGAFGTASNDLAFVSGRDLVAWTSNSSALAMLVLDLRVGQWSTWSWGAKRVAVSRGALIGAASNNPHSFNAAPGDDNIDGTTSSYGMRAKLGDIPLAGTMGGLGRMRSVKLMSDGAFSPYHITITATFDDVTTTSQFFASYQGRDLEVFFDEQKGARVTLDFASTQAYDTWTGIEIAYKPLARDKRQTRGNP